jgi:cytochrome c oxidase subunit III
MITTMTEQRGRLHPHKLMMWMAMGSLFMVFAGLTSAFILQSTGPNWVKFKLPWVFWLSTVFIIASSYTMHESVKAFKVRDRKKFKNFISFTAILGALFIASQILGFNSLYQQRITLQGNASNGFLFIICGLHIAHVVAAIVALIIVYLTAFRKSVKVYSSTSVEVMSLFWHFVDGLWIYLFLFFLLNFSF